MSTKQIKQLEVKQNPSFSPKRIVYTQCVELLRQTANIAPRVRDALQLLTQCMERESEKFAMDFGLKALFKVVSSPFYRKHGTKWFYYWIRKSHLCLPTPHFHNFACVEFLSKDETHCYDCVGLETTLDHADRGFAVESVETIRTILSDQFLSFDLAMDVRPIDELRAKWLAQIQEDKNAQISNRAPRNVIALVDGWNWMQPVFEEVSKSTSASELPRDEVVMQIGNLIDIPGVESESGTLLPTYIVSQETYDDLKSVFTKPIPPPRPVQPSKEALEKAGISLPRKELSMQIGAPENEFKGVWRFYELDCEQCLPLLWKCEERALQFHALGHPMDRIVELYGPELGWWKIFVPDEEYYDDWEDDMDIIEPDLPIDLNEEMRPVLQMQIGSADEVKDSRNDTLAMRKKLDAAKRIRKFAKQHEKKRAQQDVKQRNKDYRDAVTMEMQIGESIQGFYNTLCHITSIGNTIENWTSWASRKFQEMLPHLLATFGRWMVQPPNFMALLFDLFTIVQRIAPERVSQGWQAFLSGSTSLVSDTKRYASSRTSTRRNLEMQVGDGEDNAIVRSAWLHEIGSLLTGYRMKNRVKSIYKTAMSLGKTLKDIESYKQAITKLVSPVINFLNKYVKLAIWQKMFGGLSQDDLAQFCCDVEAIQAYGPDEVRSIEFPKQVNHLWQIAVNVTALLAKKGDTIPQETRTQLRAACRALATFREQHYVTLQKSYNPARTTPFVIALVGASGCGKSMTAPLLAKEMAEPGNCNFNIGNQDISDLIYFDAANKHKDGYVGQPVFFIDDFGQKKEDHTTPATESNMLSLIKMVSGVQFPLEMAHLHAKGTYFNSPLIMYTANQLYPKTPGLECPEALHRRRNLLVYVTKQGPNEAAGPYSNVPAGAMAHPEEHGYSYEFEDSDETLTENQLAYMDFHILPAVRRDQNGAVQYDPAISALPRHGTGMSYTDLLKRCVQDFNAWQNTSSTKRMMAKTPAHRIFGCGSQGPDVGKAIDRMEKHDVTVRSPLSMQVGGWAGQWFHTDYPELEEGENLSGFMTGLLTKYPSIRSAIGMVANAYGISKDFAASIIRDNASLFIAGFGLTTIAIFCGIWAMRATDELLEEELIPKSAIRRFVNECDPSIQAEMENYLREAQCHLDQALFAKQLAKSGLYSDLDAQMASSASYDSKIAARKAAKVQSNRHLAAMTSKLSAQMGNENIAAVEAVIFKNLRTINFHGGDGEMQALGVVGHWMVTNAHFFQVAKYLKKIKDGQCEIVMQDNGLEYLRGWISMKDVTILPDDIAIFKVPKHHNAFKDIRKHFISDTEYGKVNRVGVRMLTSKNFARSCQSTARLITQEQKYRYKETDVLCTVAKFFEMPVTNLRHGDCGSPMVVDHLNKIAGIHAAGDDSISIAVPVCKEMFDMCKQSYIMHEPELEQELEPLEMQVGQINPRGFVKDAWRNHLINKTDIKKSPIHGKVVPVVKQPSVKTLKDPRISEEAKQGEEPIYKSFFQHYDPPVDMKEGTLAKAVTAMWAVLSFIKPTIALGRRILSEYEVLNGTRDGTFPGLNLHTSAGMPQRTYAPGSPGKFAFFQHNPEGEVEWRDTEAAMKFKQDYEFYEETLLKGEIPFVMLQEQLKDETLKLSKISMAKTRTFEVFPGPLALLYRKYFGAFNAAMQADCVNSPISVGINAHSVAWARLYHRLNKFGGNVIAGDYVAWDKRLTGQAIIRAGEQTNRWYSLDKDISPEDLARDNRVRELLVIMLVHSYVVIQNYLFETHQGLPSGVPITSILNSEANWLYLLDAIFSILEEKGVMQNILPEDINDHLELALYGDDHIIALSHELQEHITFQDVQKHFRGRRVGYTDAVKSAESTFLFEDLTEVSFLKRRFVPSGATRVYAPLDKSSVEDQLNWINTNKSMNDFEALGQCFNGFQIESHLHGREYFEDLNKRLRSALEACENPLKEDALRQLKVSSYDQFWSAYNVDYSNM